MNDEELLKNRTALLKEITKVGKERDWRRAEALLRSLGSGRRTFTGPIETWRGDKIGVNRDMRSLAIGKEVSSTLTMPQGRGVKNLQAGLSFGNTFPGDGSSMYDKPKKTGVRKMTPLKRAALGFMIGDSIQSWPNKDLNYRVDPTDKARSRLYRMMSGGAIDAYEKGVGKLYREQVAQGIRRGEDKFQPRNAKGQMKKQVTWNPKSLKKPLYDMAIGKEVSSTLTMPQGRGIKNLQAGLSFGNTFPGDGSSMYDKPKKTGVTKMTPLKRAALGFMIGDSIQSWPNKDLNYRVDPTDKARSRLYRMMSGGAIDAYSTRPGSLFSDEVAQGMRRGEDKFQPRNAKGQMKKQVTWNPKSLKQPLVDMAIGKGMKYIAKGAVGDPRAQLAIDIASTLNSLTKATTGKDFSEHYQDASERFKDSGEFTTP